MDLEWKLKNQQNTETLKFVSFFFQFSSCIDVRNVYKKVIFFVYTSTSEVTYYLLEC